MVLGSPAVLAPLLPASAAEPQAPITPITAMSARPVRRRRRLGMCAPIGRVCVDTSDQLRESDLVAASGAGWPTARVGAPAGQGAPSVLVPLVGAADRTSCSAAWPAAARIACLSL